MTGCDPIRLPVTGMCEWANEERDQLPPAARINLFYQIMPAEINPERPSDMQIRQLYVKDGAAVSKVVKNSAEQNGADIRQLDFCVRRSNVDSVLGQVSYKCQFR